MSSGGFTTYLLVWVKWSFCCCPRDFQLATPWKLHNNHNRRALQPNIHKTLPRGPQNKLPPGSWADVLTEHKLLDNIAFPFTKFTLIGKPRDKLSSRNTSPYFYHPCLSFDFGQMGASLTAWNYGHWHTYLFHTPGGMCSHTCKCSWNGDTCAYAWSHTCFCPQCDGGGVHRVPLHGQLPGHNNSAVELVRELADQQAEHEHFKHPAKHPANHLFIMVEPNPSGTNNPAPVPVPISTLPLTLDRIPRIIWCNTFM